MFVIMCVLVFVDVYAFVPHVCACIGVVYIYVCVCMCIIVCILYNGAKRFVFLAPFCILRAVHILGCVPYS